MKLPPCNDWFCVYILRSKKDGSIYVGCTSDLRRRLEEHEKGMSYATKRMLPIELVYIEAYRSRGDAFRREKRLKQHGSAMRNLKLRLSGTLRNWKQDESYLSPTESLSRLIKK
jgi:putative endonuclease